MGILIESDLSDVSDLDINDPVRNVAPFQLTVCHFQQVFSYKMVASLPNTRILADCLYRLGSGISSDIDEYDLPSHEEETEVLKQLS